ncbi:MAG: R3H domain-containing nucleic acid-binding protein [Cyanobacteria bacterium P01_G01_bin.38]
MSEQQATKGIEWLSKLLTLQGISADVTSHFVEDASGDSSCWLTIDHTALSEAQLETLLGDKGAVLDSIQYLANTVLNLGQQPDLQQAYTVELNGYRKRRQEELQTMADNAIEQAKATGEEFELGGLSSAERRQVHTLLKPYEDLETFSRGKEPDRRLVVRLIGGASSEVEES